MSPRPFIEPRLKMTVEFPSAEQLFTPSNQDSIEAEVSERVYQNDAMPSGGYITLEITGNELIFDFNDDVASVREINIIQQEIIRAFDTVINHEVDESEIVVEAHIQKIISFGL